MHLVHLDPHVRRRYAGVPTHNELVNSIMDENILILLSLNQHVRHHTVYTTMYIKIQSCKCLHTYGRHGNNE